MLIKIYPIRTKEWSFDVIACVHLIMATQAKTRIPNYYKDAN